MVDYLRGIKFGAVSGFVSNIISSGIFLIFIKYLTTGSIETNLTLLQALAVSSMSISVSMVSGAVFGAILGVIYAIFSSKLPGKNSVKKAVLFSFLVFILYTLIPLLAVNVLYSYSVLPEEIPINLILFEPVQIWGLFFEFINFLMFGFLLGKLWDNFRANEILTDSKHMNTKGIKSWHIAAAATILTFIAAFFFISIDLVGLIFGTHSDMRGFGIMLGSLFLVISGILAIPAILLKTNGIKKY